MFKTSIKTLVNNLELNTVEISDGSIEMNHNKKCEYINKLANQNITVFSEVGYKSSDKIIAPSKWIELMEKELTAGSWKVIAEARESGNVGLYRSSGEVRSDLIEEILTSPFFHNLRRIAFAKEFCIGLFNS